MNEYFSRSFQKFSGSAFAFTAGGAGCFYAGADSFEENIDTLHASREETSNEVNQTNNFQNEEDQCADEAVREHGEVEAEDEADTKSWREEVYGSWPAEQLVYKEFLEALLNTKGDKDENCSYVEQGCCSLWHHYYEGQHEEGH